MYAEWRKDPALVDASWKSYFEAIEAGKQPPEHLLQPPQDILFEWGPGPSPMLPGLKIAARVPLIPSAAGDDQAKIQRLVRAFQDFGHQVAKTNPLDLPDKAPPPPELQLDFHVFTENDLDREFALGPQVLITSLFRLASPNALIMFFAKSLLRHPMAKSNIGDFMGDSKFQPLIPDPAHGISISNPPDIKRVIYCTGQV
ncbi:hypothetical protein N7527_007476 [Penicillium freii]|nr:hypothetical protein N7527_007476 [Penicillium freii]